MRSRGLFRQVPIVVLLVSLVVPGVVVSRVAVSAARGVTTSSSSPFPVPGATASGTPVPASAATAGSSPTPAPATTAGGSPTLSPADGVSLTFQFKMNSYAVVDLPFIERPDSSSSKVPRIDTGTHDRYGVRMLRIDGKLYNYPGAAAGYGLRNINTYRVTGDTFYLRRAESQAQRMIHIHTAAGALAAWYFPNLYARDRHNQRGELVEPPWYSAMAQGLVLSLFSRLSELTGVPKWRDAADHTFASFVRPGPCAGPYTVDVDSAGYYWLQEWPWPHMRPDDTLNGHLFSSFGLYDYYLLTADPTALALFRGALTTVEHYFPAFRSPGWISHYCLAHLACNAKYHQIHVQLMLQLFTITQDLTFARFADLLENDYPKPVVSGSLHIGAGTYTACRFSGNTATATKLFTVTTSRSARVTRRQRIRGRAIFYRISGGDLSGYWLQERSGRVYLRGILVPLVYLPSRAVRLKPGGAYTAFSVAADGRVRTRRAVPAGAVLLADRRAVVNGRQSVRLSGGSLGGYWLTLGRGVTLH
jgi:D-glucuronyl C5-epimerase C-terminus